jgi:penicillin-binding protein 1A
MLRFLGYLFAMGVITVFGVAFAAAYIVWDASKHLPDYEQLANYEPPVMTRVHAADGRLLAEYARERRLYVPINAIPDQVIKAFLSAEDKNFFQHGGIDPEGLVRAIVVNVRNLIQGRRMIGASTITQQVAKNFLLSSDRTVDRKLREALLALKIERAYSKDQILELYLNEIFLGLSSYGVAAASLNYFGKSLNDLTLEEAAYLAALPKAPNNYHPFKNPDRALERRNWVIDRMVINGLIGPAKAETAKAKPLEVSPRPFGAQLFAAEYFAEEVRRQVQELYGEKKLYEGGLSIRTTLDPQMQVYARRALIKGLVAYDRRGGWRGPAATIDTAGDWGIPLGKVEGPADIAPWRMAVVLSVTRTSARVGLRPDSIADGELAADRAEGTIALEQADWAFPAGQPGKVTSLERVLNVGDVVYVAPVDGAKGEWSLMQIPKVEGAIVAVDPHTGRIHALVGGFSYAQSQFNRAVQALRQPGSAFKPFVYAAALDRGYTPSSVIVDAPIEIKLDNSNNVWKPKNYGGRFYGPSTLRIGIEKSRNVMTVLLAQDLGMKVVADYAARFGIYDNLMPVLSMALGAGETTLLKMTAAFGMLDNGGKRIEPTIIDRIQDRYGRTIYRHDKRECGDCSAQGWDNQPEPVLGDDRPQIIDPHTAYQIVSMLEGVVERGTATLVSKVGKPLAGKTGTTNDERDAWFVGFSPDLAVGVYIGFDQPQPMGDKATGGDLAAPVFRDFMQLALADQPAVPFRVPPGINLIPINSTTGQRARYGDENVIFEAFKPGESPPEDSLIIGGATPAGVVLDTVPGTLSTTGSQGLTSGTGGLY